LTYTNISDLLQKALRKAKEAEDASDILTDICTDSTPNTSTPKKEIKGSIGI